MKFIARIFLFLFIAFINASHSDDDRESCDTSLFFYLKEHTQRLNLYYTDIEFKFLLGHYNKSSLILSENLSKHDKISVLYISPPPSIIFSLYFKNYCCIYTCWDSLRINYISIMTKKKIFC
jgi:hypothetical protein